MMWLIESRQVKYGKLDNFAGQLLKTKISSEGYHKFCFVKSSLQITYNRTATTFHEFISYQNLIPIMGHHIVAYESHINNDEMK